MSIVPGQPLTVLELAGIISRAVAQQWPTREELQVILSTAIDILSDQHVLALSAAPELAEIVTTLESAKAEVSKPTFAAADGAEPAKIGFAEIMALVIQYGPTILAIVQKLLAKKK